MGMMLMLRMLMLVLMLLVLLLLLQQTMDLEPIRSAAVTRTRLAHADQQAFAQTARLARGTVLLVDDAFAVGLAIGNRG